MKILIIGKGFIGERLSFFLSKVEDFEVHSISQSIVDYTNPEMLRMFLGYHANTLNASFDRIIICTGYTGKPNVDACELPENKPTAYFYNVTVPFNIVRIANEFGVRCIHVGSGCIYDGHETYYSEKDEPNFGVYSNESSFYSKTKHIAETILKDMCHIFRIRMPYTFIPGDKNYLTKILKYPITFCKFNSITCVDDFYNFIYNFILLDANYTVEFGVFNVTNPAPITANNIVDLMVEAGLEEAKTKEWKFTDDLAGIPITAKRSNCVLDTTKIASMGLILPPTEESLLRTLRMYKQYSETGTITVDTVNVDTGGAVVVENSDNTDKDESIVI